MKKLQLRLTKKFADMIDGVDLRDFMVGQKIRVTPAEARLLIAEGWAEPVDQSATTVHHYASMVRQPAAAEPR